MTLRWTRYLYYPGTTKTLLGRDDMGIRVKLLVLAGLATLAVIGLSTISGAESIDVKFGTVPTLDSTISPGEWIDAGEVTVSVGGTNGNVYFKHDGENVYMAFEYSVGQMAEVYVDKDHDAGTSPGTDDVCMHASTALMERTGTGSTWSGWSTAITGWDADTGYPNVREFSISYTFLDITAGSPKTLGVLLYLFTTSEGGYWPSTGGVSDPSTWGDMASSDNWGSTPNILPELSNTTYTPLTGDTNTDFRFQVSYRDTDDQQPALAQVHIGTVAYDMTTDSTGPWTSWSEYYYETKLPAGSDHEFHFVFSDGRDTVRFPAVDAVPNRLQGPVVTPPNRAPVLDGAWLSQDTGTRMFEFEFAINYTDPDNEAPAFGWLYLDETPFEMVAGSANWSKGVPFNFSTRLDLGTHMHYFLFSDGREDVRFPVTGSIEGPVIFNLDPTAVIESPADGLRFAPDEDISFSAVGSWDPEDDDLAYFWSSDLDGVLSEQMAFEIMLSEGWHNVSLLVTDEFGGTSSDERALRVKPYLPRPFISGVQTATIAPIEGDELKYNVTVGNDGEANAEGVEVVFLLDGVEKSSQIVNVEVGSAIGLLFGWTAEPGDFVVGFEVAGDLWEVDLHVEPNTVPTPEIDVAGGQGDPARYRVGHELTFAIDVEDAEGDELSIAWDLGDGNTVNDVQTVLHTYTAGGSYDVAVTVTDARGKSAVGTVSIQVIENHPPTVEVDQVPAAVTGDTVSFSANVSDEDGDTYTYLWDLGDGDTSTLAAPRHIYTEPGNYTVTLTVTDSEGGVTEKTFQVVIDKPKKDDGDGTPGFGGSAVAAALVCALIVAARRRS
jgi:hypothetical protein